MEERREGGEERGVCVLPASASFQYQTPRVYLVLIIYIVFINTRKSKGMKDEIKKYYHKKEKRTFKRGEK